MCGLLMEDSHRRISESCQRVRRIYQNSLEGQRMNISEDFYCRWVIAHKSEDYTSATELRTRLSADGKTHMYSVWMDDVRNVVSKHLRGNESKKNQ